MVGAILTGAKIAGNLLGNLFGKKSQSPQQPQVQLPDGAQFNAQHIALSPNAVAQAPQKSNFMDFLSKGLQVANPVMSAAGAPAINALGGGVKALLSTLNDDEWFEHYDGNGATFNELLKCEATKWSTTAGEIRPYGALAFVTIEQNTDSRFYNSFMPQILAYVRTKTNNILQDDTTKYQLAFACLTKLYELYYSLTKYYGFMLNTPSNAPTVISAIKLFRPENLNATKGVIDSLKSYLMSTAKLPYAYVSYIRWRFGTMFLSTNTKRAGFVSYDPSTAVYPSSVDANGNIINTVNPSTNRLLTPSELGIQMTPTELSTYVEAVKAVLTTCGRATADFAVAYSNHVVKYDVEDRHFDEKEFCLRQNMRGESYGYQGHPTSTSQSDLDKLCNLLLDSRIDMNAGIQAVTISTAFKTTWTGYAGTFAAFPVASVAILMDMTDFKNTFTGITAFYNNEGTTDTHKITRAVTGTEWYVINYMNQSIVSARTYVDQNTLYSDIKISLVIAAANSLELHIMSSFKAFIGGNSTASTPTITVMGAPLSYDRATITWENLHCIQRNAILNLVRGDYANKKAIDVKEQATDVVNDLTSKDVEVVQSLPNAVK